MDRLLKIGSIAEAIPSLISYGERHYERLDKLQQASYVLEYMSSLMTLLPLDEPHQSLKIKRKSREDSSSSPRFVGDAAISDEDDAYDSDDPDFVPSIFMTKKKKESILIKIKSIVNENQSEPNIVISKPLKKKIKVQKANS